MFDGDKIRRRRITVKFGRGTYGCAEASHESAEPAMRCCAMWTPFKLDKFWKFFKFYLKFFCVEVCFHERRTFRTTFAHGRCLTVIKYAEGVSPSNMGEALMAVRKPAMKVPNRPCAVVRCGRRLS